MNAKEGDQQRGFLHPFPQGQKKSVALICGRGKFGGIEGASNNLNTKKEDKIVSQSQTKINSPSPPDQVILVSVWEIFFPLGLERSEASLRQEQQGFAQTSNLSPVVYCVYYSRWYGTPKGIPDI